MQVPPAACPGGVPRPAGTDRPGELPLAVCHWLVVGCSLCAHHLLASCGLGDCECLGWVQSGKDYLFSHSWLAFLQRSWSSRLLVRCATMATNESILHFHNCKLRDNSCTYSWSDACNFRCPQLHLGLSQSDEMFIHANFLWVIFDVSQCCEFWDNCCNSCSCW